MTGPDRILPKLTKLATNVIDSHLCNAINLDIENCLFAQGVKAATVRPFYKNKPRK